MRRPANASKAGGPTCLTRVVETDEFARWCRRCGCEAAPRDSVTRRLAHEPPGCARRRCCDPRAVVCDDTVHAVTIRAYPNNNVAFKKGELAAIGGVEACTNDGCGTVNFTDVLVVK